MIVQQILDAKERHAIETISERQTLSDVVNRLADLKIGALIVTNAGGDVSGIISERDIVRQLSAKGPSCLASAVSETMTKKVVSCAPSERADEVLNTMTQGRFRHMPVMQEGALVGILSIGDVVKAKINAITAENEALESMIRGF